MKHLRYKGELKEELTWAIDKQLWRIINTVLFTTVIPLRI